ncbi:hypothetical protein PHYSODRAFT_487550, partial [Phytophthora sojae]
SYSPFTQYVHYYYPGVKLTRTAEDVCDCCVRLKIQLQQPDISDADRDALLMEKRTHITEAISHRRFVSRFVKEYTNLYAPDQLVSSEVIPDTYDLAEDFGGGISMPHYGHSRPSADYFHSNRIIHNFVVADITNKRNNVYFYDERAQGKGAGALCSLRLLYHLTTLQTDARNGIRPAEIDFSLLDNCVGENKSKVVLMFFAMLSVVFPYKKVVLYFLLPGHSHHIADRVIAWCLNKVKIVHGVFLNHNDPSHPFYVGWGDLLDKY